MTISTSTPCPVCGEPPKSMFDVIAIARGEPCMDCVKSRAAGASGGGCKCPKRLQRPGKVNQIGSRRWISCNRCLGQIKQIS